MKLPGALEMKDCIKPALKRLLLWLQVITFDKIYVTGDNDFEP
jgi:high-affinity K+ transport system ATPase subunit B